MTKYELIREQSDHVDWKSKEISNVEIIFPVPANHPRHQIIQTYPLHLLSVSKYNFDKDYLILCDQSVKDLLPQAIRESLDFVVLNPTEGSLKTLREAEKFVALYAENKYTKVIVIGGGILANFGGYIAERLNADLIYIPTTIIAMSDACIGGKVRINDIREGQYIKHAHKTFYEPSEIILDPHFLTALNDEQIRVGMAEIIKHAVYQSPRLLDFILSESFDPYLNKESLLRAILWTADLKRICLEIDPDESAGGSLPILRAAHHISDKLEEKSEFTIQHGEAVEKAMVEDLYGNHDKYTPLINIYNKLGIGYTTILN